MTLIKMIDHPDATFYALSIGKVSVFGTIAINGDRRNFEIGIESFKEAAYTNKIITDYTAGEVGNGHQVDDDVKWIGWYLGERLGTEDLNQVLKDAIRSEWENYVTRIGRTVASGLANANFTHRLSRSVDNDFCDAVLALAEIIKQVNK